MKKTLAIIACGISVFGFSQVEKDTIKSIKLDGVVVSSQRFAKSKRTITQQVESISKKEIEFQNSQNTADVFANLGTLSIQKSQQGGGSPVIRGFESSRILLVVDGIRMNNLIYRAGHLQNSISVDKNMLENIDVLFGPSSTIYGSDALGGAIYLQTKNAKLLSENGNKAITGNVLGNYSSVNEGKSGHFDLNYASSKFASLTSFSYNDYGDLKMGKQKNGSYDFFGEREFYTETKNGVDSKVANDNKYVQKFSGYKQYDFMQKLVYQQNSSTRHSINFQFSTTNDIPRYDRLTDSKAGKFATATWNYGPQIRLLGAYNFKKQKVFLNSDLNLNLSCQNIEESRITRNFGSPDQGSRIEKVSVFALNSDFKTKIGKADFIYGLDFAYDDLKSKAFKTNILTNAEGILGTRYPDGKNNTFSGEGFVYLNNNINERTSYNASMRVGYKTLKSELETNILKLPYTTVEQKNITYSGALGFVNNPSKNIKISLNVSTGFRVPNVDDLSKIFESSKAKSSLIVPNSELKPEKTVTTDLGITFWDGNKIQFENTFFLTKLYDPIITDNFIFNGSDKVTYDGVLSKVTANQNQGKATVAGLSTTFKAILARNLLFYGTFNYTYGRVENNKGNLPLDHIVPVYGKTGFRYENKYCNLDLNMNYNGNKNLRNYAPVGEDNIEYARANGTESWETYNFKASISVIKNTTIFTGIENMLDTQYRTFSSGINAGGKNIYFGAKYNF
jgi:hemoglobin/transferrin/lactoferrin receptor protein